AARATAVLLRLRMEKELADSEQRFRDLFDEAPIAYVQEDLESRFISANRAAMRILGITRDQVQEWSECRWFRRHLKQKVVFKKRSLRLVAARTRPASF